MFFVFATLPALGVYYTSDGVYDMVAVRLRLRTDDRESDSAFSQENSVQKKPVDKQSKLPAAGNLLRDRRKRPQTDLHDMWSSKNIEDHIETDPFDDRVAKLSDSFRRVGKRSAQLVTSRKLTPIKPAQRAKKTGLNNPDFRKGVPLYNAHASSLDMVSRRPKSVRTHKPQSSFLALAIEHAKTLRFLRWRPSKKLVAAIVSCLALVIGGQVIFSNRSRVGDGTKENQDSATLGANVSSSTLPQSSAQQSGPTVVTSTEFPLLVPSDTTQSALEVVLVSPPNNAPVYAYLDTYEGSELRISQQQLPDEFKDGVDAKLSEVAKDFQATDIIQIDDTKVYHGFTEKFGGVQSLVFVKKDVMVFISSAVKLSDDSWAGYILNLK